MKARPRAASSFGEIRSLPIRLGRSWRRLRPTKRKFSLSNATLTASKTRDAIGRSCATAASMLINPSLTAGWASSALVMKGSSEATSTPLVLGFRMPAEWEPHEATWLAWPHELADWPGKFEPIPWVYAEIVRHLSQVERVYLIVEDRSSESRVRKILKKSCANLVCRLLFEKKNDRGWMRDSGPICVKNSAGEVRYTHWLFNGWAKYANFKKY